MGCHDFFLLLYIYIYKIEIRNSETYLPEVSVSSIRDSSMVHRVHKKSYLNCIRLKSRDWWDNGQIEIFAAQWLMGHFCVWICQSVRLILKRKIHNGMLRWRHFTNKIHKVRFGKSTHISMISNSVTHLWSYTNSAITGISARAPISLHQMASVLWYFTMF